MLCLLWVNPLRLLGEKEEGWEGRGGRGRKKGREGGRDRRG